MKSQVRVGECRVYNVRRLADLSSSACTAETASGSLLRIVISTVQLLEIRTFSLGSPYYPTQWGKTTNSRSTPRRFNDLAFSLSRNSSESRPIGVMQACRKDAIPILSMHSRKRLSLMFGAEGRNRTGTSREGQGILSPLRLPVPPPPQAQQKQLSTLPFFAQAGGVPTQPKIAGGLHAMTGGRG